MFSDKCKTYTHLDMLHADTNKSNLSYFVINVCYFPNICLCVLIF